MSVERYADEIAEQGIDPEQLRVCDCARCGKEVLGESLHAWYCRMLEEGHQMLYIPRPGVRIDGRPFCYLCGQSVYASATDRARKVGVACVSTS